MEAFSENINALENKISIFIQKWKEIQEENKILIERNKKLEEEITKSNPDFNDNALIESGLNKSNNAFDSSYIVKAIDQYINRIDGCIDKINIELNGK